MQDFNIVIDKIVSQTDIIGLARELGLPKLQQNSGRWQACCPFHNDKKPSLQFYDKDIHPHFHCFACNAHGDVFTLVKQVNKLDFYEAVKYFADRLHIDTEGKSKYLSSLLGLNLGLQEYRNSSQKAILNDWLKKRRISQNSADKFELLAIKPPILTNRKDSGKYLAGWTRTEWDSLESAGLVKTYRKRNPDIASAFLKVITAQDVFYYDGILFPLINQNKRLQGIAVRKIDKEDDSTSIPKYRFTKGFKKSNFLYGIDKVWQRAKEKPLKQNKSGISLPFELFIVEGIIDVIRLNKLGLNAVAVLGTALSGSLDEPESQIGLLDKLSNLLDDCTLRIHLFLDNDPPGRTAISKIFRKLLTLKGKREDLQIDCILPNEKAKDPDELLKLISTNQEAEKKIHQWLVPISLYIMSELLEVKTDDVNQTWQSLNPLEKSQIFYRFKKKMMLSGDVIINDGCIAGFKNFDLINDKCDYINKLYESSNRVLLTSYTNSKDVSLDIIYSKFTKAITIAQNSYTNSDFPQDIKSWQRLERGFEILEGWFCDSLKNCEKPLEPSVPSLTPRFNGGSPRLRVLPCPEDLVIETFVLNSLFEFGINNPGTIPLVFYDIDNDHQELVTAGPVNLLPDKNETVSFAYQVNSTGLGSCYKNNDGMFRHYSKCWLDFTDFVLKKVNICPKETDSLYFERLDIHRYYDSISKSTLLDILNPCLEKALRKADKEALVLFLDGENELEDRINKIRTWICDRTFGYKFYSPDNSKEFEYPDQSQGIPQGPNLSSWLANILLFPLDHELSIEIGKLNREFNKNNDSHEKTVVAVYARYVDDIIIVTDSRTKLDKLRAKIVNHLDRIGLKLNAKNKPIPPMSPCDLNIFLLENRGMITQRSGPWNINQFIPNAQQLRSLNIGQTIDRRDALTLLHGDSFSNLKSFRTNLKKVVELIANQTDELRYNDFRAIAGKIWIWIADKHLHSNIQPPEIIKSFWELWDSLVKPLSSVIKAITPIVNPITKMGNYTQSVDHAWPLFIALEGLQKVLFSRMDNNPTLSKQDKDEYKKLREFLAANINDGLLSQIQEVGIEGKGFNPTLLKPLQAMIETRIISLKATALQISGKRDRKKINLSNLSTISIFRQIVSSCPFEQLQEVHPYSISDKNESLNNILLFHECIERLSNIRENNLATILAPLIAHFNQNSQNSLIAKLSLLIKPDSSNYDADKKINNPNVGENILPILTVLARCVGFEFQLDLLEQRKTLLTPLGMPDKCVILPTPEGMVTRGVFACCCPLGVDKRIKSFHVITHNNNTSSRTNINDVILTSEQKGFREQKTKLAGNQYSHYFIDNSEDQIKLGFASGIRNLSIEKKLGYIASFYRSLSTIIEKDKNIVLSHVNILMTPVVNNDYNIDLFSWKESENNLLDGVAFRPIHNSLSTSRIDIPSHNDWLWRIGYSLAGILGLEQLFNYSELDRLSKPALSDIGDWASNILLLSAMSILQGKYWWSKPIPSKGEEKSTNKLPRVVDEICNRIEIYSKLPQHDTIDSIRIALALSVRTDTQLMKIIFDDNNNIGRNGHGIIILNSLANFTMKADEELGECLKKLPLTLTKTKKVFRRSVDAWLKWGETFDQLATDCKKHKFDIQIDLKISLDTMSASCRAHAMSLWLRALVCEIFFGQEINFDTSIDMIVDLFQKNEPILDTDNYESKDIKQSILNLSNKLTNVKSISVSQGTQALNTITPLGWAILTGLVGIEYGFTSKFIDNNDFKDWYQKLLFIFSLPTQADEENHYPWGFIKNIYEKINSSNFELIIEGLLAFEKESGIEVKFCQGRNPLLESSQTHVEINDADGYQRSLSIYQLSNASLFGEKNGAYEKTNTDKGYLYNWTQVTIDKKIIGLSMISPFLSTFMSQTTLNDSSNTDFIQEHTAIEKTSEIDREKLTFKKESKNNQKHKENGETSFDPNVYDDFLRNIRTFQNEKWRSRQRRYGHHIRVALFQHQVKESYSHPLKEVDIKITPTDWHERKQVRSKAEYHRRCLLKETIRACHNFNVDILVLPEYSTRPETVAWISKELKKLKNKNLCIWAGTFRIPSLNHELPVQFLKVKELCKQSMSMLTVVNHDGVKHARGKRYPSVAMSEQFKPYTEKVLEPLFNSSNKEDGLGIFTTELICSEIFMATSPANLNAVTQSFAQLFNLYNAYPTSDELHFIENVVMNDLKVFSDYVSMAPSFSSEENAVPFKNFPRRTILLVPAMTSRSVDFHILGQANHLAAGICTVFCNAVYGNLAKGGSGLIGHNSTIDKANDGKPWYDDRIGPYNGVSPGIFNLSQPYSGMLGAKEQALVIADVDPVYMNEGKPRHQLLPHPLKLVAHLPVITLNTQCNSFIKELYHLIDSLDEKITDDNKKYFEEKIKFILAGLEKTGNDSPWLNHRKNAWINQRHLIKSPWPPPSTYDWLPVYLDDPKSDYPEIDVPELNPRYDDYLNRDFINK